MQNLILTVDFLGGTKIEDAAEQMVELAVKLDCIITTKFAGVDLYADARTTPERVCRDYYEAVVS